MADYGHEMQFGVFLTPDAGSADHVIELAELAEVLGLDLVTFQDHPYQPRFLDTLTLLDVVAARTSAIRVAPNVANLPLRSPFMLARAIASLDRLSGGRVELGLGAGAFWDAIAAAGGPRLTPGEAVTALSEAIEVIRAVWAPGPGTIDHVGEHYRIQGAHPGPPPAHRVEIWLGAYKPRMLALTGEKADGWLPSTGYLELADLPQMNGAIDRAAQAAGRSPAENRRLLNVSGHFGSGTGFLQGAPAEWTEQLADLALSEGMSVFMLAVSTAQEMRLFAEEVAPAVRDLVDAARRSPPSAQPEPAAIPGRAPAGAPLAAKPTVDDGRRLSSERALEEETRPTGPAPDPARLFSPDQQAAGQHLIDVHDGLRAELTRLRDLIEQVAAGTTDPALVRSHINRMTIRQNNWTLGVFCESYCRALTAHHTLEDGSVFTHLRRGEAALAPVLDRLAVEHEVIADLLERVDRVLVSLVAGEGQGIDEVRASVEVLSDALLSHFSYEERELVEPLARLGFY